MQVCRQSNDLDLLKSTGVCPVMSKGTIDHTESLILSSEPEE